MARAPRPKRRSTNDKREALLNYAVHGSAKTAAEAVGLPRRTVQDWVQRALRGDDEEGKKLLDETGQALRERIADSIERMMGDAAEMAYARIKNARWPGKFGADPTPAYMTALANIYKALWSAKTSNGGATAGTLHITVGGPDGKPVGWDPAAMPAPEPEPEKTS